MANLSGFHHKSVYILRGNNQNMPGKRAFYSTEKRKVSQLSVPFMRREHWWTVLVNLVSWVNIFDNLNKKLSRVPETL